VGINQLYFGDNIDVLRKLESESVDLVYLDPPFNSARNYNVIFARHGESAEGAAAQIHAFEDTWTWTHETQADYATYIAGLLPPRVADALTALRGLLGENDALAYLVNMAPRLMELHRVLRSTGTLWLHCDPTMSHYLKVLLDAIFDPRTFRNEVVWQRTTAKGYQTRKLAANHDVILVYGKTDRAQWNSDEAFLPYDEAELDEKTLSKYKYFDADGRRYRLADLTGPNDPRPNLTYEVMGITRRWRWARERMDQAIADGVVVQTRPGAVPQRKRYLDELRGKPLSDVWTDIPPLNSQAAERLGYPTQKPLALLERILRLASKPGDVVLDPFCGCGTTVDAAQKLDRTWIGIDVTYIAVDLILNRLKGTYGPDVLKSLQLDGVPRDVASAHALFERSAFEFERWAVAQIGAQPNQRQGGDKGIDGLGRFTLDGSLDRLGRVVVSVKGGRTLNPAMVRDLSGTLEHERAELGVLITQYPPTHGMTDAANHAGTWIHPANGEVFPRVQIVTTTQLLDGRRPKLPLLLNPYLQAPRAQSRSTQTPLFH